MKRPTAWEVVWWPKSLRENQKEAWTILVDHLQRREDGILSLSCGKGKALRHGEPVWTPDGWRSIETCTVGTPVYGTDGRVHKVTSVHHQGVRPIYRMVFTDGSHVDCDLEHQWTLVRRRDGDKEVTYTTEQLLQMPLRGKAGRRFYLPNVQPLPGREVAVPVNPYVLGLLLGDGGMTAGSRCTVSFTSADRELLDAVKEFYQIRHLEKYDYRVNGAVTDMKTLGLWGCSSHTKFIPAVYKYASPDQRLALLQGLLDTDGSPTAAGAAEYATVSSRLRRDVQELVWSLGGTATKQVRVTRCNGKFFLSFCLLIKLPQGMRMFRLARKQSLVKTNRQREPYRALDKIVFKGYDEATCITVDAPNALFLTRDGIPTHNTVVSIRRRSDSSDL